MGLHLNEGKLYTIGGAKYRDWVNELDRKLQEASDEVEIDLEDWSPYVGQELSTPEDTAIVAAAGARALDLWSEMTKPGVERQSGLDLWVYRRLSRTALGYLRATKSPGGLGMVRKLIRREPQMTEVIALYLAELVDQEPDGVNGALQEIVESTRLSGWQSLWLFEVPIRDQSPPSWAAEWLEPALAIGESDAVRARASLALASMDSVGEQVVANMFETVGPAARPDVALAAAFLGQGSSAIADTIKAENPILRWVVEDGTAQFDVEVAVEDSPF